MRTCPECNGTGRIAGGLECMPCYGTGEFVGLKTPDQERDEGWEESQLIQAEELGYTTDDWEREASSFQYPDM